LEDEKRALETRVAAKEDEVRDLERRVREKDDDKRSIEDKLRLKVKVHILYWDILID
jgi:hypothetical protein